MLSLKLCRTALLAGLLLTVTIATAGQAFSQSDNPQQTLEKARVDTTTGLEVQLHLLVATMSPGGDENRLPSSLNPVVNQLRSNLGFKNYRLAATLINRVRSGGKLSLRWVGGPLLASAAANTATPGFNEFHVGLVRLIQDEGREIVQMTDFHFGTKIPIQIATANSGSSVPVVQYEPTGISTDITVQEGTPTIVGTLNVGPSGDALIIVVSARRAVPR